MAIFFYHCQNESSSVKDVFRAISCIVYRKLIGGSIHAT